MYIVCGHLNGISATYSIPAKGNYKYVHICNCMYISSLVNYSDLKQMFNLNPV